MRYYLGCRQHGLASLAVDGQRQLVVVSTTFVQAASSQNTKPPMQQRAERLGVIIRPSVTSIYATKKTLATKQTLRKMPHFIIDCSADIIQQKTPEEIMEAVYETAEATGLFADNDIKIRINPYEHYKLGKTKKNFIHIFGNIMEGRSTEQKADLSRKIIQRLNEMFPDISILSMNVTEFEKATYSNKSLINPLNTTNNRHFER